MFLQCPITMWTATAKVLNGRERGKKRKSCPGLSYYVTMESDKRSGKGNEQSHRREIRRARFRNTFLLLSVLCNKHCTLHVRLRSLISIHSFLLKIDQLACNNGLSGFKSYVHTTSTNSFRQANQQILYKKKEKTKTSQINRMGQSAWRSPSCH